MRKWTRITEQITIRVLLTTVIAAGYTSESACMLLHIVTRQSGLPHESCIFEAQSYVIQTI